METGYVSIGIEGQNNLIFINQNWKTPVSVFTHDLQGYHLKVIYRVVSGH